MLPATIYMPSDKDRTMVITTIGIDRTEDNGYNITTLAIIPKGTEDINANLEIFEGEGKTIAEALDNIAINNGKTAGLAHCDCIIISEELLQDNIVQILDYFIRTANLTTNATIIATDSKSKELLEATKSSNNLLDLSLKNIVMFQEENSLLENITIENFYRAYFSRSSTFYLPIISTEEPKKEESVSSGSGAGTQGNEPEVGGSSGGSGSSGQLKIKNESKVALIKYGKLERELTDDEKFIYNLLSPSSDYARIEVDNINDSFVNNSREVYQQVNKFILPIYKFIDGKPTIEYNIWLSLMIDEISSTENFAYASIDSLQSFLSQPVKDEINKQINEKLEKTLELIHEKGDDILEVYEKFNAFKHRHWKEYLSSLESPDDYMKNVDLKINLHLNYVI